MDKYGYARSKPTDVSKETNTIPGELILDQVNRLLKFRHRDGSILYIEGNNYETFYEYLRENFVVYNTATSTGTIEAKVDKATMNADRLMVFDADLDIQATQSKSVVSTSPIERVSCHITVYDKERDTIMAVMPKVMVSDVYTLKNNNGTWSCVTLPEIITTIEASISSLATSTANTYVTKTAYTTDKETFFLKGAIDTSKYANAAALATAIETVASSLSSNYLQKGTGLNTTTYPTIKAITDAVDTINSSLSSTGTIGSKLNTVYTNYLPKGSGYDTDYGTSYPTIHKIVESVIDNTQGVAALENNLLNYLEKGSGYDSAYGTNYPTIYKIVEKVIALSNATTTNASSISSINSTISTFLAKGAGFDTTTYPNLKAITTAIEGKVIPTDYLKLGASWSTKYSTYSSMYDVMEKVTAIESKETTFEATVAATYFPFGPMTADDKTEFPNMYSVIDDIRNNNLFRTFHVNPETQLVMHSTVLDRVQTLINSAINSANADINTSIESLETEIETTNTAINTLKGSIYIPSVLTLKEVDRAFGEITGYTPFIHITSFNEDNAYGQPGFLGANGSCKRVRNIIGACGKSVRKTFPGVYVVISRSVKSAGADAANNRGIAAYMNPDYYKLFSAHETPNTVDNDIRYYFPLANIGENTNYQVDMGGGTTYANIDIIPSKTKSSYYLLTYNRDTSTVEIHLINIAAATKTAVDSFAVAAGSAINKIDTMFRVVDVTNGDTPTSAQLILAASCSALDLRFYSINNDTGALKTYAATISTTSPIRIAQAYHDTAYTVDTFVGRGIMLAADDNYYSYLKLLVVSGLSNHTYASAHVSSFSVNVSGITKLSAQTIPIAIKALDKDSWFVYYLDTSTGEVIRVGVDIDLDMLTATAIERPLNNTFKTYMPGDRLQPRGVGLWAEKVDDGMWALWETNISTTTWLADPRIPGAASYFDKPLKVYTLSYLY